MYTCKGADDSMRYLSVKWFCPTHYRIKKLGESYGLEIHFISSWCFVQIVGALLMYRY